MQGYNGAGILSLDAICDLLEANSLKYISPGIILNILKAKIKEN